MSTFQEILESAGCDVRSYSGRGMYGKECLGTVIAQDVSRFWAQILDACDHDSDDIDAVVRAMECTKTDSMGYDTIMYWPDESAPADEVDNESDDEDSGDTADVE